MKILIVIPSYKPAYVYGGPIYSVSRLAEALVQRGNEVTVYTTNANGSDELDIKTDFPFDIEGVTVYYFKRWSRGHSNFSPKLLFQLFRNLKTFDVIHIQSWWNLVTVPAALICSIGGKTPMISPRGTLTVYTLTHKGHFLKSIFHKWIGTTLLKKSVLFFSTLREWKEASKLIEISKYYVIPNLLDLYPSTLPREHNEECLQILFLGRIDPAKNLELVFDALKDDPGFKYQWTIAGEGHESYLRECKEKTKDVSGIFLLGSIAGEAKFHLLANADVLVLPSHTENFGNVIIEALSQGTAVLMSRHVGIGDYVVSHRLGLFVDDNPESWKEALRALAMDKSVLHDIRKRAPEIISRDFQPQVIAEEYQKAYEEVLRHAY